MGGLTPVTATDCVVLVGIGLDADRRALEATIPGTLAHARRGLPGHPAENAHVRQALRDLEYLGAWVPECTGLATVTAAARRASVLVFVSHYDPAYGLQLGTELVDLATLGDALPSWWRGVIDLGACDSADGLPALRARCPGARLLAHGARHRLAVRMSIVRATLRCLAAAPAPYFDALSCVVEEMALRSKEHRS